MKQPNEEPTIDRSRRVLFDEVADLYDEVRPRYPEALIEDVIALSGIPANGRILEVGCGPGIATLPFARRGYRMLGIELGGRLTALAAQNCRPYPAVEIRQIAFEEWQIEENAFDLAISGEAFHWIPPQVGYPRLAQALKPDGSAALFWILRIDPGTAVYQAIAAVHQKVAPFVMPTETIVTPEWLTQRIEANFAESGCFGQVRVRPYSWSELLTGEQYIKRLNTQSAYRNLDEPTRQKLLVACLDVIEEFGGMVERPYLDLLFHADQSL